MLLNCVGRALAKNGSFAKLGFCVGLCGFANVPFVRWLFLLFLSSSFLSLSLSFRVSANGLQLPEGGDFGALHCQPSTNFDRSIKLDLTTEPPLLGRCC